MLIDNESGAFVSGGVAYQGGPGLFESTSAGGDQVVDLERLGGDGVTWVSVGELVPLTGNGVLDFDLDKCIIRANMASGTAVFADIKTRRVSM